MSTHDDERSAVRKRREPVTEAGVEEELRRMH
jgi:hypothetical protein